MKSTCWIHEKAGYLRVYFTILSVCRIHNLVVLLVDILRFFFLDWNKSQFKEKLVYGVENMKTAVRISLSFVTKSVIVMTGYLPQGERFRRQNCWLRTRRFSQYLPWQQSNGKILQKRCQKLCKTIHKHVNSDNRVDQCSIILNFLNRTARVSDDSKTWNLVTSSGAEIPLIPPSGDWYNLFCSVSLNLTCARALKGIETTAQVYDSTRQVAGC